MEGGAADPAKPAPRHGLRIGVIWAVLTVICTPLVVVLVGPHLSPGAMSVQGRDQHEINVVLTGLATPIVLFIWVYFGYSLAVFRQRGEAIEDGPGLKGSPPPQIAWVVVTTVIVLGLAVWGTEELLGSAKGAGGGQGPNPLAVPTGGKSALQVQVIGQQWDWTFRYPSYGGVETDHLALPVGRVVALHVTSLDVTHSFWAYELGVKADAVSGVDNVTYVKARRAGSFQIRCAELCGLWHGHMNETGHVMSATAFAGWIGRQQVGYAPDLSYLPPYSHTYFPEPLRRAG